MPSCVVVNDHNIEIPVYNLSCILEREYYNHTEKIESYFYKNYYDKFPADCILIHYHKHILENLKETKKIPKDVRLFLEYMVYKYNDFYLEYNR